MKDTSSELGQLHISRLLIKQAVPASVGFIVMSIYSIADTIYVGRFIGTYALGGVTVVMPISFLISSIGMAIGMGGASVISRSFGSGLRDRAFLTFGNQIGFTAVLSIITVGIGAYFADEILFAFGGKGEILPYARDYFEIILIGVPFLAWSMMANNVIRAEGKARWAMYTLVIPALLNLILDPIFILALDMGIKGAAWATVISYFFGAMYTVVFFFSKYTEMRVRASSFLPNISILREVFSLGSITFARQGAISLLILVLNNSLYAYSGEEGVAVYGIINRISMFALFPVIGIVQGFLPIAGYNYGAGNFGRLKSLISIANLYGALVCVIMAAAVLLFAERIISVFTTDQNLIKHSVGPLRWVFATVPLFALQLLGSAYFQAIGKALPAMLLTLAKQGFFLIPLVILFPLMWGEAGIWLAFPVSDILSSALISIFLYRELRQLHKKLN
jgi:putative MATE family efflux protein